MRRLAIAALTLLSAPHAAAQGWTTSSHVGFGVVDRSSTGFDEVTGSLAFIDVLRPAFGRTAVGLRTLAQGGRAPAGEFYRIGAGPLVSVALDDRWSLLGGLQAFNETGLDAGGEAAYRSRGLALLAGWERLVPLGRRVDLTWGGFVARHQGSMHHVAGVASAGSGRYADVDRNVALSRGVALGLKVRL